MPTGRASRSPGEITLEWVLKKSFKNWHLFREALEKRLFKSIHSETIFECLKKNFSIGAYFRVLKNFWLLLGIKSLELKIWFRLENF